MPRVAVVLGTFNGQRFLSEQLDSLARQTRLPDQLVVTDDESTDDTIAIVRHFAQRAPFDVDLHIQPKNCGFPDNFMSGAMRAKADIIAFSDQDDIWRADKLQKVEEAFHDRETAMCVHSADLIDAEGAILPGQFTQGIVNSSVAPPLSNPPWGCYFGFSVAFRSSLLSLLRSDERCADPILNKGEKLAHDRWIYFLADIARKTAKLAEPLVQYRQHEENAFGAVNSDALKLISTNLEHIRLRADRYLDASIQKLAQIEATIPSAKPADKRVLEQGAVCWRRVVFSLTQRREVYAATNTCARAARVAQNLWTGVYKDVHTDQLNLRAFTKDSLTIFKSWPKQSVALACFALFAG